MHLKTSLTSFLVLLLFTGAAMAQAGADDGASAGSPHQSDCEAERDEAYAEAERDYQEDLADAEDADDEREAKEDYDDERADADEEYDECLQDARSDAADDARDRAEDRRDRDDDDDGQVPDSYTGRHVSFAITDHGIRDYTVDDATILAAVSIRSNASWDEFEQEGASVELEGEGAELKVSDTPTGVFRFEAEDDHLIQIEVAGGVEIRRGPLDDHRGHGKHHVLLVSDEFTAKMFLEEGYRIDNDTILTRDEVRMAVVDADGLRDRHSNKTAEAIADGRIAVEVDVDKMRGLRGAEHGDVNVTLESTDTGLVATVESHGEGKTVLFNLEPGALGNVEDLEVIFDGVPIGLADDVADVLDVSDGVAEYIILVGAAQTQVMVQVPHFSVHTIELASASVLGDSPTLVSVAALVIGAGVATAFVASTLIARRR